MKEINFKTKIINKAEFFFVKNTREAIDLASHFMEDGEFDMFRGLANSKWEVLSTLHRHGSPYTKSWEYELFAELFSGTIWNTPSLKYLANDPDSIRAIAQHYGRPTTFIDFTSDPKVAAFFAIDGRPESLKRNSCSIVCANKERLKKVLQIISNALCKPGEVSRHFRIVEIDVSNLWRLQAQKGLFLSTPLIHLHDKILRIEPDLFTFDRIIFPFEEDSYKFNPEEYYPVHKSDLELNIDRCLHKFYFEKLIHHAGSLHVVDLYNHADGENPHKDPFFIDGVMPDPLWQSKLDELESNPWIEHYQDIQSKIFIEIHINLLEEKKEFRKGLKNALKEQINKNEKEPKRKIHNYHVVISNDGYKLINPAFLETGLKAIWEGMRRYSYSINEIIESQTVFLLLQLEDYQVEITKVVEKKYINSEEFVLKKYLKQPVNIRMAAMDAGDSKSYARKQDFFDCLREDYLEVLKPEMKEALIAGDLGKFFFVAPDAIYLFNYKALLKLFIRQIIPIEIYLGRHMHLHITIFYSPLEIAHIWLTDQGAIIL